MQTTIPKKWDTIAIINTNFWEIKIKLFPDLTPKTFANFTTHAKDWYYDTTIFHRVINNFMIQWWDPEGSWMWWESIYWKAFEDEFSSLRHIKWALSMANSGRNTNWSQFFIVQAPSTPHLDWRHTVFWQVFEWIEVVDKIAISKTDRNDSPLDEVIIRNIEIVVL